jgi:hypothetical protein
MIMDTRAQEDSKEHLRANIREQNKSSEDHRESDQSAPPVHKRGIFRRFIWPPLKILFYAVFLFGAAILILLGLEGSAKYSLSRSHYSKPFPDDLSAVKLDKTKPVSHYEYDFVPRTCVEENIFKGNRYEYANNAGFREPRDISLEKPQDEFRIFLTGGSTAFGLGATGATAQAVGYYSVEYRETISHVMEMILNATAPIPGKRIRIYNTGVWGHAYQHNLIRYITKLRLYQPDLVISLDGANEIPLISKLSEDWNYFHEAQYSAFLRQIFSYGGFGLASYLTLWLKNNTYLMTRLWVGRDTMQDLSGAFRHHTGHGQDREQASDAPEASVEARSRLADRNVSTVVRVVEDYHSALQNDGVPHIFALQPWFYLSKKPLDEKEKIVTQIGEKRHYYEIPSDEMYKLLIDSITSSATRKGFILVDFSDYFDDVSEWVFTDWCHLTAGANYLIAKELANVVKELLHQKELSAGDRVSNRDTYFWDLAASGNVFYAPPADSTENGPRNMLLGYPRESLYSSQVLPPEERLEVVLDLNQQCPVSRLRLVWADEDSVPEEWVFETSIDGEQWHPLIQGGKNETDSYSRWPGFEYYAAEPVQARYARYRPVKAQQRSIRLRSWNIFR